MQASTGLSVFVWLRYTAKRTMLSLPKCASQGRMSDTNRNLTAKTMLLLGELAKAMGPAFEGVGRPLLSTAVGNISDSKSQVQGYDLSVICTAQICNNSASFVLHCPRQPVKGVWPHHHSKGEQDVLLPGVID